MSGMAEVLKEHAPNVDIQRDYDYASVYRIWCDATECDFTTDGIDGETRVFEAFADHQADMLAAAGFGPVQEDWMTEATRGSFEALRREMQAVALEEAADKVLGPSDVLLDGATCRWIAMELKEQAAAVRGEG